MLRRIKEKINPKKAKESISVFRAEYRKAAGTAIIAAFSFLIALVWKDVIALYVNNALKANNINSELASALLVTFIAVIGMMITSRILANKAENDAKEGIKTG
ncbi:hypothetical protein HYW74_02810 [Candidatus Pacearchaeota archaeon]|nr:hypothetical protein [Candidatus Pacearchaeota archaeon]